ncbi:alpha/beta hydrolase domain-containing protein [Paracraurococcus lichenis]|uniref:Alpha/beta hydrolase domain-containing protein n=1 Tax=Paracraurococcus lichenis TaxID=3064888 RepID=A0ABT9DT32_9PROT|nr:alpha/beta hydrolase domain-containing protein [Paracraurococcus sp. LOR1-02]MDO9707057.1 alpha/beta hydrolase domain-containing protein [Paracraurococcus sp. LOR1-02]
MHQTAITLEVTAEEPFAGGQDFGAGPYRRIAAIARGALDPADPRNAVIADLGLAPRNAERLVEYATEVVLLRPADPTRANGRLLYDVTNRGRKMLFGSVFDAPGGQAELNALRSPASVGLALPLRAGTTLAWSGWDPEAPRANDGLRIDLPVLPGVTGLVRDEFVFGTRITPADRPTAPLSYPVADRDPARASLTVRRHRGDPPRPVAFAYAGERAIRLEPEGTRFEPGSIYDFRYPATGARPLGMGWAATRDVVSHLRHGAPAALGGIALRTTIALGISQAGRWLRHLVDLGMNADLAGQRVFDGVLTHVAGAGRVFGNERFAQPDRTATWHEDLGFPEVWFPMAAAEVVDPMTGRRAALLKGDGSDPLLMQVNSSTEYWQKGASLIHADPAGTRDLPEPPDVRHYLVAGTKHGGRFGATTARGNAFHLNNPHSASPLLRALLAALEDWVETGRAPPPSRVPRIADGTLLPAEAVLAAFPDLPATRRPRRATPIAPVTDWVAETRGPEEAWRPLVPAVDADGNERAGVRLPDIAVPRGTYTGWNLYAAEGLQAEPCDREGSLFPFALDAAARAASGDPRPSLAERYPDAEGYVAAVRAAAAALVADRLLLPADAEAYVTAAQQAGPAPLSR